jgi:large subunit ribosomal protein L28
MVKSCIVTGKKVTTGWRVSHSNRHTKRRLFPNLQKRRLLNPATGKMVTVAITSRGLRTLKKWRKEGKAYDLAAMAKSLQSE